MAMDGQATAILNSICNAVSTPTEYWILIHDHHVYYKFNNVCAKNFSAPHFVNVSIQTKRPFSHAQPQLPITKQ